MASFNKAILARTLQQDIELRYTTRGEAVTELQLSVSCPGHPEETTYVPLEARGTLPLASGAYAVDKPSWFSAPFTPDATSHQASPTRVNWR